MRLRSLEVSNRVRNWIKVKLQFRGVETWIMPIGNINIHIKINVSESINRLVSFLFCEFNYVSSWNECKDIILVRSSFQFPKEKYWFHFQGQRMSMQTCLFLIVILKETLVLMCLASHFVIIESWKLNVGHRDINYAKKY